MRTAVALVVALVAAPLSSQEPVFERAGRSSPGPRARPVPLAAADSRQERADAAPRAPLDLAARSGRPRVQRTADGARADAVDYRVRFAPDGWHFSACAGERDGAWPTLRYAVAQVGRRPAGGALRGAAVGDAAPSVDGDSVCYARPGFVERYELRRDGVAQSFVFETLPAGKGDLVVRGRLATELRPVASAKDVPELRFTRGDGAGIAFGRVTGIDARGARAEGSMRYEDGHLDLVLPGAFVDAAALPLTLDPIIGPTISVPASKHQPPYFDVGYDASTDRFLYAWDATEYVFEEPFEFPVARVYARLLTPSGAFVGGATIAYEEYEPYTYSWAGDVRVAPAGSRPGFIVVYTIIYDLGAGTYATYVDATTGAVSARVRVGALDDVGASASGDVAIVVHRQCWSGGCDLIATRLSIDAAGRVSIAGSRTLATAGDASSLGRASISTTAGPEDRYLIVWDETRGTEQNLFCAFLDSDLNVLDSGAVGLSATNKRSPAVDGDGTKWCVAYETVSSGSVMCFGVFWDPNSESGYVTGDVPVAAAGSDPVVAWTGESYLIAYRGGARSVDPFTCLPCEGDISLPYPDRLHRIGSQRSSSPAAGDLAMIASRSAVSYQLLANATFFRADDGRITDLGGGCGRGGRAAATCARAGNPDFTLRIRGALPFAPVALVLGAAPLGFPCGPCTLVTDPATGFALGAGGTDRWGDAAVRAPLPGVPSLVGAQLLEQWLVAGGAGSCLGVGDLSNALRVEIQ